MPEILSSGLRELCCIKLVEDLLYEQGVLCRLSSAERLCVCSPACCACVCLCRCVCRK